MSIPFKQVDVFTSVPFKGNPVAVVLDAAGFADTDMQAIARWTNLSETTFVTTPTRHEADYAVRIFTPGGELPFAGHPTLGTAWALMEAGMAPRVPGLLMQECGKGLIPVCIEESLLSFALPEPKFIEPSTSQRIALARALGVAQHEIYAAAIVDVGPVWFTAQLGSPQQVVNLRPSMAAIAALEAGQDGVCVFGMATRGKSVVEVRSFAPGMGVPEDPVCGSGNGTVAAMIRRATSQSVGYVALQGRCVGRDGRVTVRYAADGTIWLGGASVTCVSGTIVPPKEQAQA